MSLPVPEYLFWWVSSHYFLRSTPDLENWLLLSNDYSLLQIYCFEPQIDIFNEFLRIAKYISGPNNDIKLSDLQISDFHTPECCFQC